MTTPNSVQSVWIKQSVVPSLTLPGLIVGHEMNCAALSSCGLKSCIPTGKNNKPGKPTKSGPEFHFYFFNAIWKNNSKNWCMRPFGCSACNTRYLVDQSQYEHNLLPTHVIELELIQSVLRNRSPLIPVADNSYPREYAIANAAYLNWTKMTNLWPLK